MELDHNCGRINDLGIDHRDTCGLVDGIRAIETDQRYLTLDALNQDVASGWCAVPDLPAFH